jgi:hypothetical protein
MNSPNQVYISFSHPIDDEKTIRLLSLMEGFEQNNMLVSTINDDCINILLICLTSSGKDSSQRFEIAKCIEQKRKNEKRELLFLLMDDNLEHQFDEYLKPYDYIYFTEVRHIFTVINYINYKRADKQCIK